MPIDFVRMGIQWVSTKDLKQMPMTKFNKVQLLTTQYPTREQRSKFDFESRSVCALFARLVKEAKLELPIGWGVNGEFVTDQPAPRFVYSSGLHKVWVSDDITVFEELALLEKKEFFLQKIVQLMKLLSENYQFDVLPFHEIAEKIREMGYVNTWEWKVGRKYSPNKELRSRVFVTHEVEYFELTVQFLRKDGSVFFEKIIRPNSRPDEMLIDSVLGKLEWTSDVEIEISRKLMEPQDRPIRVSCTEVAPT